MVSINVLMLLTAFCCIPTIQHIGPIQIYLDNSSKIPIIRNEEQDFTAAPHAYEIVWPKRPQKLPSLARVAVVFCAAILLMGFPDNDRHRELANMKSDTHTSIPPFGE